MNKWYTVNEAAEILGCSPKILINLKYRNGLKCSICIPKDEVMRLSHVIVNGHMPSGNRFKNAKYLANIRKRDRIDKIVDRVIERLSHNENSTCIDEMAIESKITNDMTLAEVEKAVVLNTIRLVKNRSEAARKLGISRRSLYCKLDEYHVTYLQLIGKPGKP